MEPNILPSSTQASGPSWQPHTALLTPSLEAASLSEMWDVAAYVGATHTVLVKMWEHIWLQPKKPVSWREVAILPAGSGLYCAWEYVFLEQPLSVELFLVHRAEAFGQEVFG